MDLDFYIEYIKQNKALLEHEGAKVEIIIGKEVLDEIMSYLFYSIPLDYKDIKLFGSTVHIDFKDTRVIKITKVCTQIYI